VDYPSLRPIANHSELQAVSRGDRKYSFTFEKWLPGGKRKSIRITSMQNDRHAWMRYMGYVCPSPYVFIVFVLTRKVVCGRHPHSRICNATGGFTWLNFANCRASPTKAYVAA